MSTEANKALVRRYNDEVWNRANVAAVDETIGDDLLWGADHVTPEGIKEFVAMIRVIFPDFQATIEDMVAEGDKVFIRETCRGTHLGEMQGTPVGTIAPTGKQVTFTGNVLYRIANQKIVEDLAEMDMLGLLQQVGALPRPEEAQQTAE